MENDKKKDTVNHTKTSMKKNPDEDSVKGMAKYAIEEKVGSLKGGRLGSDTSLNISNIVNKGDNFVDLNNMIDKGGI